MSKVLFWFCLCFIILSPITLFAQTEVHGSVSGVWEASGSPYLVTGELHVPTDSSLRIMPGCSVIFQGHYKFCVDSAASFKAIGTEEDSIYFTSYYPELGHHGIRLNRSAESCSLVYCKIEYGNATDDDDSSLTLDDYGGGICCYRSNLDVINCRIRDNSAIFGGGIAFFYSNVNIKNNTIEDNYADWRGGGIYCENSTPVISKNIIRKSS